MAAIRTTSSILGPDGQPIVREILTEEISGPTVTGVRQVFAEHPSDGLTPRRLGGILRDAEQGAADAYLALAEDIEEKFIHYRSVLGTRRLAVSQLPITVEAASDDAKDVEAADLVREVLNGDEVDSVLFDLLDGIGKGYAASEIIWDTSGREWRPAHIEHRDPRWFQFDPLDGRTLRLKDADHPFGRDLEPYKYIVHRPKTKSGLPIRGGLARPACWAWIFTSFGTKDWLSFIETYGQPIRVGRYGPGASDKDIATLMRAVRNIAADAAAVIPQSMGLEFIRAEGASANADMFKALLEFFERQTSKLVLGQTTTTDAVAGGHAVSQEHRLVQEDIEGADGHQLAATLRRDLASPTVRLNLGPDVRIPFIRIGRPKAENLTVLVSAVKDLGPLGLRVSASEMRDKLGFSDPAADEEVIGGRPAPVPPPPGAPPGAAPDGLTKPPATAAKSLAAEGAPGPDDVDRLVDAMLADYAELTAPAVEAVIAAAKAARGPEDFLARLAGLAGSQDVAPLQEGLARGEFIANVAARVGATGGGDV